MSVPRNCLLPASVHRRRLTASDLGGLAPDEKRNEAGKCQQLLSSNIRRRTGGTSTSSDATSLDLALVVYDEESTSGTARDLPLVAYNVNEASATAGSSSSHAGVVSAGSPVQARAQQPALHTPT